jgi:hypothetical protein
MKKFFILLEDLWVAAAFAEAGEYDLLRQPLMQALHEPVRIQAML